VAVDPERCVLKAENYIEATKHAPQTTLREVVGQTMFDELLAERERRARVTLALAEVQAAEKIVEAANLYAGNERAFQLRWINVLHELGLQGEGPR
jgi:regulator of protease activity HflC (stomatin/prohibitin superfamily)